MELFDYEREHLNTLRSYLGECCVLLKRDGKFPLKKPCRIGAYGNGIRKTVKGGTGSGEVNSRHFVTVYEGLKSAGFEITSEEWLSSYDSAYSDARREFVREIKREARKNGSDRCRQIVGKGDDITVCQDLSASITSSIISISSFLITAESLVLYIS